MFRGLHIHTYTYSTYNTQALYWRMSMQSMNAYPWRICRMLYRVPWGQAIIPCTKARDICSKALDVPYSGKFSRDKIFANDLFPMVAHKYTGLRVPDPGVRIPNSEFRIPNFEFRIPNFEFRIPNSGIRITKSERRIINSVTFAVKWSFCEL